MENKYKNEIPNKMLGDAHLNCASISFIVMKLLGKTMPTYNCKSSGGFNNKEQPNRTSLFSPIGQWPLCEYTYATLKAIIHKRNAVF